MHTEDSSTKIPEDLINRLTTAKSRGNIDQIDQFFKNLSIQEENTNTYLKRLKELLEQEKAQDLILSQNTNAYKGRIKSDIASKP